MQIFDIVIVGAGHAGAQAAISLRQMGFEGTIALIGDEPDLPYERPPLSKEYFSGEKSFDRILIRPASFWQEREITLLLGKRITQVNADARFVAAGAEQFGYGKLIWCTGGSPRQLTCQGADAANVHGVRRRQDVDAPVPHARRFFARRALDRRGRQQSSRECWARRLETISRSACSDRAKREGGTCGTGGRSLAD